MSIDEKEPEHNLAKHQYVFYDSQRGIKKLTHKIEDSLKDQLEEVVYFIHKEESENEELRVALLLSHVVAKQRTRKKLDTLTQTTSGIHSFFHLIKDQKDIHNNCLDEHHGRTDHLMTKREAPKTRQNRIPDF